jgi:hypothetical protein
MEPAGEWRHNMSYKVFTALLALVMLVGLTTAPAVANLDSAQGHSQAFFFVLDNAVEGQGWTPGGTVTVTVDDTDFEETVEVFTESEYGWIGPGGFLLETVDFTFQPGQTVRVTSDDQPPVVKSHTVTALRVSEVNSADDTVAGTTNSEPGSIIEVGIHHEGIWRFVEVQNDGSWLADFSEEIEDHGQGWGKSFDIQPGVGGWAHEYDDDGDGTSLNWEARLVEIDAKDQCKDGGWREAGFRNQGQCIRFVNTGKDSR